MQFASPELLFAELTRLLDAAPRITEVGFVLDTEPFRRNASASMPPSSSSSSSSSSAPASTATPSPLSSSLCAPFVLVEGNLGIAFWCVAPLCRYSAALHRDARARRSAAADSSLQAVLLSSSRVLTLLTGEQYTAWNTRKVRFVVVEQQNERNERFFCIWRCLLRTLLASTTLTHSRAHSLAHSLCTATRCRRHAQLC